MFTSTQGTLSGEIMSFTSATYKTATILVLTVTYPNVRAKPLLTSQTNMANILALLKASYKNTHRAIRGPAARRFGDIIQWSFSDNHKTAPTEPFGNGLERVRSLSPRQTNFCALRVGLFYLPHDRLSAPGSPRMDDMGSDTARADLVRTSFKGTY